MSPHRLPYALQQDPQRRYSSDYSMNIFSLWFRIPFWQRVLGGFLLGALAGWLVGAPAETWFGPLGKLYVTLIKIGRAHV